LYVEDEAKIAKFVYTGLNEQGFVVDYCSDGSEGYNRAIDNDYDAIVLDIMLPGKDGLSILKSLRRARRNVPAILLTARNELDDRIEGLNLGADDYLAKPFFVEELVARIHAVIVCLYARADSIVLYYRVAGVKQPLLLLRRLNSELVDSLNQEPPDF
jgi:DNA-binding response OmpR family regulator